MSVTEESRTVVARRMPERAPSHGLVELPLVASRALIGVLARFSRSSLLGAGSIAFLIILVFVAIFADQIAPYGPLVADYTALIHPPSLAHLAGTDNLGRDALSRVIIGARTTLFVAFTSIAIGEAVGSAWGVISGYAGGRFDLLSQRFLDVLMAFPGVILALLLLVALSAGVDTIIIAIAVTRVPGTARVIRSVVLSVREMDFVTSARAIGASPARVMAFHVAPQVVAPLLVIFASGLGGAIFAEAALSFLGLGIPPPAPSWGNMLGGILVTSFNPPWWLVVVPGLAITFTILALNLFGDALRDYLDPKLRGRLQQ
ncbi:MAG: ABC transporter permease [Chloroflexi bacterium]|nr:ABC transporter permease [Chloroflexota bacterium]